MGWVSRHIVAIREVGLGGLAIGCAISALGLGGDMTLIAIALIAGWLLGSIALVTLPEKSKRWKLVATSLLAAFFIVEGGFLYQHFHEASSPRPALSGAQFDELKQISLFVGQKDEFQLQQLFDFPRLMAKNVSMIKDMIRLRKQGKIGQFDIANYEEKNHQLILDLKGSTQDSNGRYILRDDPNELPGIIITDGFVAAKQKLLSFETSPLVPQSVIDKLKSLNGTIDDNTGILLDLLQEKANKEDDRYFLEENTTDSKYQKAIDNLFAERRSPLEPKAVAIIETIRRYLGTN
jgi:hypothetical protein